MNLAYLNIGASEMIILLIIFPVVVLLIFVAIGRFGQPTQLGYIGSILLALFTTPILAFLIIWYMRSRIKISDTTNPS